MSADGSSVATPRRSVELARAHVPGTAAKTLAVSVGIAVPAVVLGKAVMGVALVPAVLVAMFALSQPEIRRAVARVALQPAGLALALFGLVSLVSALSSLDVSKSAETWARTAAFVLFGIVVAEVLTRDRHALALAQRSLLVATLLALAYVSFAVYIADDTLAVIGWGKHEDEPIAKAFKGFASAAICLLPVALWSSAGPELIRKATRLVLLVLVAAAIWLDEIQLSEAAILGIVCACALVGLVALVGRLPQVFRPVAVAGILAAGLALAVAVTVSLPDQRQTDAERFDIPTWLVDGHRQVIWSFTVAAAERRPLLGYGPNTINKIEGADRVGPVRGGDVMPSHPHNWVYEIASETGLIGLAVLSIALVLLLRTVAVRALNASKAGWAGIALFGAFWGSALVNFSIWAAWWQLTFIVLMAIVTAAARPPVPGRGPK